MRSMGHICGYIFTYFLKILAGSSSSKAAQQHNLVRLNLDVSKADALCLSSCLKALFTGWKASIMRFSCILCSIWRY